MNQALVLSAVKALVLVAGGLLLGYFLRPFLTEKGKNLASKQDVQELTRLVEGAKAEYASDLERLRADISSEGQVVERRRRVYEDVCAVLHIFTAGHGDSPEAREAFHSAYAAAWLWASDSVLMSLGKFLDLQVQVAASPGSVAQSVLKAAYAEVVLAMREDVGFEATAMAATDYKFVQFGP